MGLIELNETVYRDKVMGCWLGKNAGGTLGTPFEKAYGYREPFNVSFYTKVQEGGVPNDDLELQIVWLMALEERGLSITCRDLAEYWLNHVGYNFDEYGYLKQNLRMGLCPPITGCFNNPFLDCMGSPIRSEIWACIAPGLPDVAAHYAWHDAVCDHAGGESVYGEIFNAALESAAFVVADRDTLLDIGLSAIPVDCKTAQTIRKAREVHRQGMNWLGARNAVLDFAYHFNAQYSPVNLGFLTIGWLYGQDFGDALCKAVNCGYDTDCTAATLGAILGIINGAGALPAKWVEPLGKTIAITPAPGIVDLNTPDTTDDLTDRVVAIGRQLLAKHYPRIRLLAGCSTTSAVDPVALMDKHAIQDILNRSCDTVVHTLSAVEVGVRFPEMPGVSMSRPLKVEISLKNRGTQPLAGILRIQVPDGFACDLPEAQPFSIPGHSKIALPLNSFTAEDPSKIFNVNRAWFYLDIEKHPSNEAIPIPMIGAKRWLVSKLIPGQTIDSPAPVMRTTGCTEFDSVADWCGNELDIEPFFNQTSGVIYLQHYLWNSKTRPVRLCVANSHRMKLWVNGIEKNRTKKIVPCRPALWGDTDPDLEWYTDENGHRLIDHINSNDMELPCGWNHIAIKLERGQDPLRAFFTLASLPDYHGLEDIQQTRFPWDVADPEYAHHSYTNDWVLK